MEILKKAFTFDDVNEILKDYNITINDLNIKQVESIKIILKNNLDNLLNTITNYKLQFTFNRINNKKIFNSDDYLSNKFITDEDIEKLYGKYIYIDKPEDNLILRSKWIDNKNDNGKYYYLNYLLKKNNRIDNKYIENKKKELSELLKNVEKSFKKQKFDKKDNSTKYKYKAYIISEHDANDGFKILKNTLLNDTIVFYKDNLYIWNGKLKPFDNSLEENTIALVGNELWVWQKGLWSKSNATPKYDNIYSLCSFNNMDLNNVKLDSLDCIYRKETGCHSKLYIRLKENITRLKDDLDNFQKINENILNFENNIRNEMENIKKKYFYEKTKNIESKNNESKNNESKNIESKNIESKNNESKNNESKNNESKNNESKKKVDSLSILLKLINNIENNDIRLNYIYNLIDKDGIIIDNLIYSKKYKKCYGICSHYIFFKKINYANSPDEKIRLIDEMYSNYSDNGYSDKEAHTCKICGDIIGVNDYDETEGFSESGMIKKSRELWEIEKIEDNKKINLIEYINISDLDHNELKEMLLKNGLNINDIDEAISISLFITNNLFIKCGISLSNQNIINIIIDSLQKIRLIIPFTYFRLTKIKSMEDKGFSKMKIEDIDKKGIIKNEYDKYFRLKKSAIISARLLISIQTNIPNILRSSKSSICPFYSFNDNEGIRYMACILNEMKIIEIKDKTKSLEILHNTILENYDEFKHLYHIKKLFTEKKEYDIKSSQKSEDLKFKVNNKNEIELEKKLNEKYKIIPEKLNNNFNKLILKNINSENINKFHIVLLNRLYFLSRNIRKIINEVINNSSISNSYTVLESSCCTEEAQSYLNYYY
jgi:hypothetical protein